MAETALLLLAADAVKHHPGVREQVDAGARLLIPVAHGDRMRVGLLLYPAIAQDFALAHVCLSQIGYPDPAFDRLLAQSAAASAALGRERPPHRDLEQKWLRALQSPEGSVTPRGDLDLSRRTMLGKTMDALGSTRDDVYALTHAIMYTTDLGKRRGQLARPVGAILADSEAALAWALDEQDYDLGGEVLLAWPMLRRRWSAPAVFGFLVLAGVEDAAGFLPAPSTRVDRYLTLGGEERARYALATAYHTVYVMGLLCAACLRPGFRLPASIPGRGGSPGSGKELLALLEDAERTPHWHGVFARLAPGQQDAIASLLMTIGLRRAFARRDLRTLHTLLEIGIRHRLIDAPAPRQAAELLQRAALYETPQVTVSAPDPEDSTGP